MSGGQGTAIVRGVMALATALAASPAAAQLEDRPAIVAGGVALRGVPTGRDDKSRALYLALIDDMRRSGQTHAALAHLDAFEKSYPRTGEAAILRADCLVDIRDYAGASAIYARLLRGRQAAAASAGLGRIEAIGDRWPSAVDHYARAVSIEPTSTVYLNDYGFALLRAGRPADALFRLRQAAELAPADSRVRNNLALALAASGDEPAARRLVAAISDPAERSEIEAEIDGRLKVSVAPLGREAGR